MYRKIFQTVLLCAFMFLLFISINAQNKNLAQKSLSVSKKATVVIVGQSAKFGYKATKFTAKRVAKPIIVKSAPRAAKFVFKQTGNVIKTSYPVVKKLFVKYVKYKIIP